LGKIDLEILLIMVFMDNNNSNLNVPPQMKHSNTPKSRRGFTIMEMMIALSTIAIIATTSLQVASRITQKAESAKLDSDMKVLNSAATIYQKFGGDLSEAADSNRVLQKLITIANSEYADRIPGLSGSMIDPRLRGIKANRGGSGLKPGEDSLE